MIIEKIMSNKATSQNMRYAKIMDGTMPIFSQFGNDIYASDIVQMCINVIATECSKLRPQHIRLNDRGLQVKVNSSLNRLFKIAPNELMTTKDFIEKIIWLLYMNDNCFLYPIYKNENNKRIYTGIYPLKPNLVTFIRDASNTLYCKLEFGNGDVLTVPYSELIHIRRKYSVNDFMGGGADGQPDNQALLKVLKINDTVLQGIGKAIKTSLSVRGIIKINTMLDDEKQEQARLKFEEKVQNGDSSLVPLDLKNDYVPITLDPKILDKETMAFLQDKVLNWFSVSLPILKGDFTDEQYQAFYEKTLEPLIIGLGQAFSKALFTDTELNHGNEIVFYPQKLLFTNTKNKIAVADILGNRGALDNNALLEMFGYPPYEGGEVRFVNLNYVNADIADMYQLRRAGMGEGNAVKEK